MNAIIVEDEAIAAEALKSLVHEIDEEINILVTLQSIDESVEWLQEHQMPDLVFMDIHLADGSAFKIFEQVKITCPIVFTTAYDEYALRAFEVNSIDYLLKPIDKRELERSINKYKDLTSYKKDNSELINRLLENINQHKHKNFFLVPEKDKLIPLAMSEIAYIFIDAKIVKAVSFENKVYYLDQTLDELMHQLDPSVFYRANRQYIISRMAVKDISIWFSGKLSINLKVPASERIIVSKMKAGEFKKWFVN